MSTADASRSHNKSPQPSDNIKTKTNTVTSDSDASVETNSLSADSATEQQMTTTNQNASKGKKLRKFRSRRSSEWEIIEGLKDGQRFEIKPSPFTGFLHKKRKWPLKGWHKRYFVLDKGLLVYAKNPNDIAKGKLHGSLDIGLSVITAKAKRRRIDIDAEEFIYHLKSKSSETFMDWVKQLTVHRLYRQHILTYGVGSCTTSRNETNPQSTLGSYQQPQTVTSEPLEGVSAKSRKAHPTNRSMPSHRHASPTSGITPMSRTLVSSAITATTTLTSGVVTSASVAPLRLNTWLHDARSSLDQYQHDAVHIEQSIGILCKLMEQIEANGATGSDSGGVDALNVTPVVNSSVIAGVAIKKDRRKFGLKRKKTQKGGSVDLSTQFQTRTNTAGTDNDNTSPISSINSGTGLSSSAPQDHNFGPHLGTSQLCSSFTSATTDNLSNADGISITADSQLREDFVVLAKQIMSNMKTLCFAISTERDRLKAALDAECAMSNSNYSVGNLKNNLNQMIQQNAELKSRLIKIHECSDLSDLTTIEQLRTDKNHRTHNASLSYSSSCVSATEFFDAEDLPTDKTLVLDPDDDYEDYEEDEEHEMQEEESEVRSRSESSSEVGSLSSGEGGSLSSESELGTELTNVDSHGVLTTAGTQGLTGRRTVLPSPRPVTEGLSLWNLLSRNIGKDLSQISMPVALNEPLNVLQRLCEELEYSELLDRAAETADPYDRMVLVCAFAVSAYASTVSRAGSKPFNPLLGETYECIRDDRGFRFLAEQVSHHPPISVCYANSRNYTFWQDARVKTKFWGKSMEFQPVGSVHLMLPKTGDLYTWNKVTTCVHNLFGGQRWVDQYGELKISNQHISAKLTFAKASYWSAKRHEVVGSVMDQHGKVVRRLFGKWSEALHCGETPASAQCVWRAGTLPTNHESYYGFTRFAIELNELTTSDINSLPPTDTRFRPDQRALEEGDLDKAESLKMQLESAQRDRRKRREELGVDYEPRWFSAVPIDPSIASQSSDLSNEDCTWQFSGKYWEIRQSPGFANLHFESLW